MSNRVKTVTSRSYRTATAMAGSPLRAAVTRTRRHSHFVPILLQKSQIARRQFSCCKKIRPTTADRCGPNHVTEVASELSLVAFHNEPPPAFRAPPKSCDAHFHIFGPAERYPYGSATTENLRYAPPLAPLSDYLELAKLLGVERFVFVQPSAYGRDNACMLDAMREIGVARCRGIADVDENSPDSALAEMDKLGVRGVRINVSPVKPLAPGFSETMRPRIERLDARCAEMGWQLDFLHPGWLTEELLPVFVRLRCSFTIAHMGIDRKSTR